MQRRLAKDENAISGVFDSIIFFVIMVIASAVVLSSISLYIVHNSNLDSREYSSVLVDDFLDSTLISTLNEANFTMAGETYYLHDDTIEMAIYYYLELVNEPSNDLTNLSSGINNSFRQGVNDEYHYLMHATFTDDSESFLIISDSAVEITDMPNVRYSSFREILGGSSVTEVTLYIWK